MTDTDTEFQRYKRFRETAKALNGKLVRQLRSSSLKKCGKDLGIYKNGKFTFGSEDETSILMDYCIHSQRIGKKSLLDIFIEQSSYEALSDEMMILKALSNSYFTVISITATERNYLVHALDILRQQTLTLIDSGLGQTAKPGLLVATRLLRLPAGDYYMTTGAGIPFMSDAALGGLERIIRKYAATPDKGDLSRSQELSLAKQLIRMQLRTQSQGHMEYTNVNEPNI